MAEQKKTLLIGVSRPALEIQDLPTPEEVFKIPSINLKRMVKFVIGPSLIALGVSVGSGEWLLGPLNVATYGFVGIGWVILISAVEVVQRHGRTGIAADIQGLIRREVQ